MSKHIDEELNSGKKRPLAALGVLAIATPVVIGVTSAPLLFAQATQSLLVGTPGQPRPAFEVASVKQMDHDKMQGNHEGHQLTAERLVDRTELIQFISMAYFRGNVCTLKTVLGWDCPYIVGSVPQWVKDDRYEIQAKIPANSLPNYTEPQLTSGDTPEIDLMLQRLLEERFGLRVHRETRELPAYVLNVGKNGAKVNPSVAGSERVNAADGTVHEVHGQKGLRRITSPDGSSRIQFTFRSGTLDQVAEVLGQSLELPVLNRTGLEGYYDFVIQYEEVPPQRGVPPTGFLLGATPGALSVALQQIGFKLESTKAPIEVLVIDHVERPSEN